MDKLVEMLGVVLNTLDAMDTVSVELTTLKNQINHFLMSQCEHEMVDDYVDISPEESIPIQYCSKCGFH
jgi:hypothetical protein